MTAKKRELASDELRSYVNGVAARYRVYISAEDGLLSLLYDIDLLPEQLLHVLDVNPPAAGPNATRMAAICELWRDLAEARAVIRDIVADIAGAHTTHAAAIAKAQEDRR